MEKMAIHFDGKYTLVLDRQELDAIMDNCGFPTQYRPDITGAMIIVGDGDYKELWFCEGAAPYSNDAIYHNLEYYK